MKITASAMIKKAILLALVVGVTGCKTSSKNRATRPINNATSTQKTVVTDPAPTGTTPEIDKMTEAQRKAEAEAEARKKAEADKKAKDDAAAAAAAAARAQAAASESRDSGATAVVSEADKKAEADRKAKEEADRLAKLEADKKAKEEADKKTQAILDAAKAKQEAQEKKLADAKAAADKKTADKKPTEIKSSAGNGNLMNAKLEIVQDEANALKGDTCSLALAKSEQEGLALKMTLGEATIDINAEAEWFNEKEQSFNMEALEKINGQKVAAAKSSPVTYFIMIFRTDKAAKVVHLTRTYYTITDKSIGEVKNPQQILDYVNANSQKTVTDANYDGMQLSLDTLKIQLNDKNQPVGFSYGFQDVVNGTTVLTDGRPTSFKSKNGLKANCKPEEVAAK